MRSALLWPPLRRDSRVSPRLAVLTIALTSIFLWALLLRAAEALYG